VEEEYPPLAGSEWLLQDSFTPARYVLFWTGGGNSGEGEGFDTSAGFQDKLRMKNWRAARFFGTIIFGNKGRAVVLPSGQVTEMYRGEVMEWGSLRKLKKEVVIGFSKP